MTFRTRLFLTSLLSPTDFQTHGWWKVLAHPHLATWANYSNVWQNTDIPHAIVLTAEIAIGGTVVANMAVKIGVTLAYARRQGASAAIALGASTAVLVASLAAAWLRQ